MPSTSLPIPSALVQSLVDVPGFNEAAFLEVHASGRQVVSLRTNPAKPAAISFPDVNMEPIPWAKHGSYVSERPSFTFDPLFHAGAYYVQEASSMFLEQALSQLVNLSKPMTILDLCAAPGGKSTHLQSLISPESVLVSNELVKPRVNILLENMIKWGGSNSIITNNDPADFGKLPPLFDVIVIDAPCSGSGLFRKDPEAIEEWSEANVQMCSMRQQKIIEDVWPSLKPGGLLLYSTCSYSVAEDEDIADFIADSWPVENCRLELDASWGITETVSSKHGHFGYRFYPHKTNGEGFYLACFVKGDQENATATIKPAKLTNDKKLLTLATPWLKEDNGVHLYQYKEQLFAIPEACMELFLFLQKRLHIRKAGIKLGDLARNELIPDHALALSTLYHHGIARIELNKEQAIAFLRRELFEIDELTKGWLMCFYNDLPIGWIKSLGNRFNNYYPKEWRIRT
jgi:16S rRNA C967 or C1407 C5-methylase (RsmB/RsmF family)/NOL1/NOP2/fmu family ribosome biogenesis protein